MLGVIRDNMRRSYLIVFEAEELWKTTALKKKHGKFIETDLWELYVQQYDL